MIAGDRESCNANKISISVRTPMCHSRESGNPWGTSLSGELASLEDGCPANTQRISAYAGMTRKCRVRIAHAALTSRETVGLRSCHRYDGAASRRGMKRVRSAHPTIVRTKICHSREGGNPFGFCVREERLNIEANFLVDAKWIPAYAGMTGWPTGWPWARATIGMGWPALTLGMPVTAASMRFVGHALPRTKHTAAPGNAKKYRAQISYAGLLVRRCDERNRVAFVASIHSKISAIHGNYAVFWKKFAHSDQAKIGEVRLAVTVALRQRRELRQMFVAIKCQADESVLKHCQYQPGILKMKGGFCEHRFTRKQRFGNLRSQMQRPLVVGIATINKRDQKTGIGDAFQAREKPLRLDRPFGPFMLPARRMNPWLAAAVRAFSNCSRTNLPFDTPDLAAVSSSQAASSSLTRIEIV